MEEKKVKKTTTKKTNVKKEAKPVARNTNTKKTTKKQAKFNDERIKQIISEQISNINQIEVENNIKKEEIKVEKSKGVKDNKAKKPEKTEKVEKTEKIKKIKKIEKPVEVKKKSEIVEEEVEEEVKKSKNSFDPKVVEEKIEKKKKLPKDLKKKIYKKIFINFIIAIFIALYLIFVNLGFLNIEPEKFLIDIKVFSIILIMITLYLFERAYKKDSGELTITGIEFLILSLVSLCFSYIYIIDYNNFGKIDLFISLIFIIYYFIKGATIYTLAKNKYKNSISDVKQIIEDD